MDTGNDSDTRRQPRQGPAQAMGSSGSGGSGGSAEAMTTGQFAEQLKPLVDDALSAVRDASQRLREQASRASDRAYEYARDEPWKALLIAAAAGALVVGLAALIARDGD